MSNKPNKTPADPRFADRTDAPHAPNDLPMDIIGSAETASVAPAPARRKVASVYEAAVVGAEQARNSWRVTVPAGTTPDDLRNPMFWAHNARRFRPGDKLEILLQDWSRYINALVREVTPRAGVSIVITSDVQLEQLRRSEASGFYVENTPGLNWCVMRRADKSRVSQNHATQADAYAWLAANADRV